MLADAMGAIVDVVIEGAAVITGDILDISWADISIDAPRISFKLAFLQNGQEDVSQCPTTRYVDRSCATKVSEKLSLSESKNLMHTWIGPRTATD